jgi:hypothetical protein
MKMSLASKAVVFGLLGVSSPLGLARDCALVINVLEVHGGRPLPYRVVNFTAEFSNADLAASFAGLSVPKIPCGVYRYAVARADMQVSQLVGTITGWVTLDDLRQRLTIQTDGAIYDSKGQAYAVDGTGPADHPILGTVTGLKPLAEPAVVRLIDIRFNREAREVEVDPDGHFEFHTPGQGNYVLFVLQGTHLLAAQDLAVDLKADSNVVRLQVSPAP